MCCRVFEIVDRDKSDRFAVITPSFAPKKLDCADIRSTTTTMKLSAAVLLSVAASAQAFQSPAAIAGASKTALAMGFDMSGNSWKPDSEKMGSTDVGYVS